MTIKELLNDTSNQTSFNLQLPKSIISFLRSQAFHLTEDTGKKVSQVSLVKKAIIEYYKEDIKKYLKEKSK